MLELAVATIVNGLPIIVYDEVGDVDFIFCQSSNCF
jgi:hypothetical protein